MALTDAEILQATALALMRHSVIQKETSGGSKQMAVIMPYIVSINMNTRLVEIVGLD